VEPKLNKRKPGYVYRLTGRQRHVAYISPESLQSLKAYGYVEGLTITEAVWKLLCLGLERELYRMRREEVKKIWGACLKKMLGEVGKSH
jgi:hypothetical protein